MRQKTSSSTPYVHASRAVFVTWVADKHIPIIGAIAHADGLVYRYTGDSVISDLPGWIPHGDTTAAYFGLDLTGATDDNVKLAAAFAAGNGKTIILPAGIINWTQLAGAIGTMATGTIVQGQGIGVTILRMNVPSTAFARAFQWQNPRVIMRDFTFILPTLANCSGNFANHLAGDGRLERVRFEGGVTGTSSPSHAANVMNTSTTTDFGNFSFIDCEFDKITTSFQKTNAATSIHSNIEYRGCKFTDCYILGLSLNSPSGGLDGLNVINCTFENNPRSTAGNGT